MFLYKNLGTFWAYLCLINMDSVFLIKDWFLGMQIDVMAYVKRGYGARSGLKRPIISEAKMLRTGFICEES